MSPVTVDSLNQIASEYPGGRLTVYQIIESASRYAVQWQIVFGGEESFLRFVNPGGFQETMQAAIDKEFEELQERITMDIFGTKLFPYLQGEMFGGKDVTLTIKSVKIEELASNRGKESKPVIYFKERPKGLILNKTNAKAIVKLYGRETNDWIGKQITMYTEAGEWFGRPGLAIRVYDKPTKASKPKTSAGKAAAEVNAMSDEEVRKFVDDLPGNGELSEDEALAELIWNEQDGQPELFPGAA